MGWKIERERGVSGGVVGVGGAKGGRQKEPKVELNEIGKGRVCRDLPSRPTFPEPGKQILLFSDG